MPLTAMEAQSCGRPVAAFMLGGLSDIVAHAASGRLAVPFDTDSFAEAIKSLFESSTGTRCISDTARSRSTATWSADIVATSYLSAYASLP